MSSLLRTRRQFLNRLGPCPLARNFASVESVPRLHEPSPSQLLRFILTASPDPPPEPDQNADLRSKILGLFDSQWTANSPPVAFWGALRGIPSMLDPDDTHRLFDSIDIPSLQTMVERLQIETQEEGLLPATRSPSLAVLLNHCMVRNTNSEIISFLDDLAVRIERLGLPPSPQVFELGMIYSGLELSIPAFHKFLERHQKLDKPQPLAMGHFIVWALSEGLSSALFENPNYDTRPLLKMITGEEDMSSQVSIRLHDQLQLASGSWSQYLRLLARIQSKGVLHNSWGRFLKELQKKDDLEHHNAYRVALALLDSSRPETALRFLEDIAVQNQHVLPYIHTFSRLSDFLDHPTICTALPNLVTYTEYGKILKACLRSMEQRLGVKWTCTDESDQGQGRHVSTRGNPPVTFDNRPLITIDGDCAGYDALARLYAELGSRGCSKSRRDLEQIVDLLHEHDGRAYAVQPQSPYFRRENRLFQSGLQSFSSIGFQWRPQHSPLEFSDSPLPCVTDWSAPADATSLGLLRARKIIHGKPRMDAQCLHLMQLGYLDVRHEPDQPWTPSGYIVALDREYGSILAVFVGPKQGIIDPGPTGLGSPFGPVFALCSKRASHGLMLPTNRKVRDLRGHYYLDIDPSPDLDPR